MLKIDSTNVTVMVTDMDKSIRFYETIGMKLKNRWDNHYAMVETAGLTLGIHPSDGSVKANSHMSIGMMVADLRDAKAVLDKAGIPYKEESGKSGSYLHFHDPDGTFLYFTQPSWSN